MPLHVVCRGEECRSGTSVMYYIIHNTLCPLQVVRLDPFHAVSPTLALYTATVPDWDTVTLACPSLNKVREGDHHCVFCIQTFTFTFTGFCLFTSHLNALYQDQESTLYIYPVTSPVTVAA